MEGWGASWGTKSISGQWGHIQFSHINWLELNAILLALSIGAPAYKAKPLQSLPANRQQNSSVF